MPPKSPSLYDLKKTTIWFAVASIILFAGLFVMVFQDSDREWKHWQREYMEVSRKIAEGDLQAAEKSVDQAKLTETKKKLEEGKASAAAHKAQIEKAKSEMAKLELEYSNAKTAFQDLKQFQDSDRYFFEEHHHKGLKSAEQYRKQLDERAPVLDQAKLLMEQLDAKREAKQQEIDSFSSSAEDAERELRKIEQDIIRFEGKIEKLKPTWYQEILNAPMLDFIRPSLQIQQIVVPKLQDDFYFAKSQKVDRCITCHLGIDQKGFENAEGPLKTHPRLDLFLSSNSPHPMEEFGCTVCHGGSGHSATFYTAAHTPKNEEQAKAWEKEYHWHPMKHWSEKMLPLNHTEAACAKCHTGTVEVPQAPKLNKGREVAETFGCMGCHKVAGMDRWKVGPDLHGVQSKLDQDWIIRWLQDPKGFRPSTHMPRIFHLSNTSDEASKEKSNAAIAGIAAYLIKNSDAVSLQAPPSKGDAVAGEKLVKDLGCAGCHTAAGLAANNHGPELIGMGSKVKAEWLYTWLKDPKHYSPTTRMPNLRLTDEQASDITAYLLTLKNEKFESAPIPLVKPDTVDNLAMTFLTGKMRKEEAKTALEKMSADERMEFVGKQSISHQGCFGCHAIKGFEDAKNIGTELSQEGSKEVDKLDFGFIKIEKNRQAWFFQKLKEPRIFDEGRERTYHEKLRMPNFDFTDEQAEALTTFILSLQKADVPLEMQKTLGDGGEKIEAGRLLVHQFNCQGCHTLDGKEGRVRSVIEDKGNAPPIIEGEGKKVQEAWLYHFLENPTTIRPWLKYKMPTFGFSDQQITALIDYFNALDKVSVKYNNQMPKVSNEEIAAGHELFKSLQCIKCHKSNPDPKMSASFLAPNLLIAKERLRPEWVVEWLKDPQAIQAGTMMPGFFPEGQSPIQNILDGDASKQMKAIRDYLWVFTPEEAEKMTQTSAQPAPSKAAA